MKFALKDMYYDIVNIFVKFENLMIELNIVMKSNHFYHIHVKLAKHFLAQQELSLAQLSLFLIFETYI